MRVLDLFSGIGAFSLGLERAGMTTVAFCEIDPFARRVLAKHWPEVPCYDDVRTLTADRLRRDGICPDVICGGFPCQDISVAGRGTGIRGERSGLWSEFARLIGEMGPRYVLVENVAALLGRGLGDVLGDLASLGYDAEWHCIPAAAIGAPHIRDRIWIVAYPISGLLWDESRRRNGTCRAGKVEPRDDGASLPVAYTHRAGCGGPRPAQPAGWQCDPVAAGSGQEVANPFDTGLGGSADVVGDDADKRAPAQRSGPLPDAASEGQPQPIWSGRPILNREALQPARQDGSGWYPWLIEPDVGRVADGVAARVDRLRGLGNSLVPQIPELIGRAILAGDT